MSQETVDQKLREWNETWFGSNKSIEAQKDDDIPDFLKKEIKYYLIRMSKYAVIHNHYNVFLE